MLSKPNHWTPARIAEARQRAELAESVTLPVEQFRELLERVVPVPVLGWKKIEHGMRDGTYLTTNNLEATDAFGRMSHLWLTKFIQESSEPEKRGRFICFDEGMRSVEHLSHYIELDLSLATHAAISAAVDKINGGGDV